MMQVADIPLGEYVPDQPGYTAPGVVLAENTLPSPGGYSPFRLPDASTASLASATVYGAKMFRDEDGNIVYAGGTSTDLFVRQGATISTTSVASSLGSSQYWRFAQFNSLLIAVSPTNAPYYLTDLASDTTWSLLPGSPPVARVVGRIGDFLVLGDIAGARSRVQWSAFNNPTAAWTTDRAKQSGFAPLPLEYGPITAIMDDPFPIVFQERALWRFQPTGGATVFQRIPAAEGVGAIAPGSVVTRGQTTFFLSDHGFYETNGSGVSPIGEQRVNRTFLADVRPDKLAETHAAIDWANECVVWSYVSRSGSGTFDRYIAYSYAERRWSHGEVTLDYLTEATSDGETLESLEAEFGSIDDIPGSLDDPRYAASGSVLGAWRQDGAGNSVLARFNGETMSAKFQTREFQPQSGRRCMVSGVRLIAENQNENTQAAVVERSPNAGSGQITTTPAVVGADGFAPTRANAHFVAAFAQIPEGANWNRASAIQARYRVAGRR